MNKWYNKVTLIIVTYNRPRFLNRLLLHLSSYNTPINVLIVDCSKNIYAEQNSQMCNSFNVLNIEYCRFTEDMNVFEVHKLAANLCTLPYVSYCQDDDFAFLDFLEEGTNFLENNSDYTCCNGRYYLYSSGCGFLQPSNSYTDEDSLMRFCKGIYNISPISAGVHRKEAIISSYNIGVTVPDFSVLQEPIITSFGGIFGKIGVLDLISFYHTFHSNNIASRKCIEIFHSIYLDKIVSSTQSYYNILYPFFSSNYTADQFYDSFTSAILNFLSGFIFPYSSLIEANIQSLTPKYGLRIDQIDQIYKITKEYIGLEVNELYYDAGKYYWKYFSANTYNYDNDITEFESFKIFRQEVMEAKKPCKEKWVQFLFRNDFIKEYNQFKQSLISEFPKILSFSSLGAVDHIFLDIFSKSIQGCFIQDFESASSICRKLDISNPESQQRVNCNKVLYLILQNPLPI